MIDDKPDIKVGDPGWQVHYAELDGEQVQATSAKASPPGDPLGGWVELREQGGKITRTYGRVRIRRCRA